mmetsp:Transcript_1876/g.5957  ORF Transcript_1876/g.5957 Transcript_1876/m.5957 type:complete len:166 (-) Transcript_1876:1187-1684(-)
MGCGSSTPAPHAQPPAGPARRKPLPRHGLGHSKMATLAGRHDVTTQAVDALACAFYNTCRVFEPSRLVHNGSVVLLPVFRVFGATPCLGPLPAGPKAGQVTVLHPPLLHSCLQLAQHVEQVACGAACRRHRRLVQWRLALDQLDTAGQDSTCRNDRGSQAKVSGL